MSSEIGTDEAVEGWAAAIEVDVAQVFFRGQMLIRYFPDWARENGIQPNTMCSLPPAQFAEMVHAVVQRMRDEGKGDDPFVRGAEMLEWVKHIGQCRGVGFRR